MVRPIGRPRRRLGDNIKLDFKEIDMSVFWIHVTQIGIDMRVCSGFV
jgi:hypothetical protein